MSGITAVNKAEQNSLPLSSYVLWDLDIEGRQVAEFYSLLTGMNSLLLRVRKQIQKLDLLKVTP